MNRYSLCLAITSLFALSQFTAGNETYEIKCRSPRPGDVNAVRSVTAFDVKIHRVTIEGDEMPTEAFESALSKDDQTKNSTTVYRDTVLETRDETIVSRKRRYQQIESISNKAPSKHLIQQDVIVDNHDGEFSFHFPDGPELLGEEAAWLRNDFRMENKLLPNWGYPKHPVKVQEEWTMDARALAKLYATELASEFKIDADGASATGVLKRVYRRDGVLYGVMRFKIRIPYEESPPGMSDESDDEEELPDGTPAPEDQAVQPKSQEGNLLAEAKPVAAPSDAKSPPKLTLYELGPQTREPLVKAARELLVEVTADTPIDGSNGPTQAETRFRLIRTKWESIVQVELEVKGTVHQKITPLVKQHVKDQ